MRLTIILALVYVLVYPLVMRILAFLQRKLTIDAKIKRAHKKKKKIDESKLPKPVWVRMRKLLGFAFKDSRPISIKKDKTIPVQRRFVFFGLWVVGLILTVVSTLGDSFSAYWFLAGMVLFIATIVFGLLSSRSVINMRKKQISRMLEVAVTKLNQSSKFESNPEQVVRVLEWRDYVKPKKVELNIPTSFSEESEPGFLRHFNQIFGREVSWVPDTTKDKEGWDYERGILTLRITPPLPQKAPWDEHYVLDEGIAWSFFPLAIGVDEGIELKNPNTDKVEHVLGFDLAGEQKKVGGKAGLTMAEIPQTVAPMILVAGTTGGGKALDSETNVLVLDDEDVERYNRGESIWQ